MPVDAGLGDQGQKLAVRHFQQGGTCRLHPQQNSPWRGARQRAFGVVGIREEQSRLLQHRLLLVGLTNHPDVPADAPAKGRRLHRCPVVLHREPQNVPVVLVAVVCVAARVDPPHR